MFKAIRKVLSKVGRSRGHSADDLFKSAKSEINHFAFIIDGNRRWSRLHGVSYQVGYEKSFVEIMPILIEHVFSKGVSTFSALGASLNSLKRPKEEVDAFMQAFHLMIEKVCVLGLQKGWRFRLLGDITKLPPKMQVLIKDVESKTAHNTAHYFNLALAYTGPDEVCRAVKKYYQNGETIDSLTPERLLNYLDTAGLPFPCPDIIFRPSGDQRPSGFLSFQSHYAELYFTNTSVLDLTVRDIDLAFKDYSTRRRRFGL
ncbi:di-trans,poly-cis-decaprenylcistransferase [bacterium]|nr:di-trans,poly-cis-decaprenylcistransferase [bacterium]